MSPPIVQTRPEPAQWRLRSGELNDAASNFRRQLGFGSHRPVVLSGHQAGFCHPGILAKALAAGAMRERFDVQIGWLVVDQDASEVENLRYPRIDQTSAIGVSAGAWRVVPPETAALQRADCAVASIPACTLTEPLPTDAATSEIARGLRAMGECLARHASAATLGEQLARANSELLQSVLPAPMDLIFASRLSRTDAFRGLLEKMMDDPRSCVLAYNKAVAECGLHGIAPLIINETKNLWELPLWQISMPGKPEPRKRVFAAGLSEMPLDTLAPRAILMTGLLRWLGCDLFVHGLGGGASSADNGAGESGYDRVAEAWFRHWLGVELAPSVVVTATMLAPMGVEPTQSPVGVRAIRQRVHQAQHAPGVLGEAALQRAKDAFVQRMAACDDRAERKKIYQEMHGVIAAYRSDHADALARLAREADEAEDRLAAEAVLRDRTWPWPIYPRTMLLALKRAIEAKVAEVPR